MCRIVYLPNQSLIEKGDLISWLSVLENSGGGSGNGIAYTNSANELVIRKSDIIKSLIDEIENPNSPLLFHTRMATAGTGGLDLCHPFKINDNKALVHNGHWTDYKEARWALVGHAPVEELARASDTKIAALFVAQNGEEVLDIINDDVWVIYDNDRKVSTLYYYTGSFYFGVDETLKSWIYGTDLSWLKSKYYCTEFFEPMYESIIELGVDGPNIIRGNVIEARMVSNVKYFRGSNSCRVCWNATKNGKDVCDDCLDFYTRDGSPKQLEPIGTSVLAYDFCDYCGEQGEIFTEFEGEYYTDGVYYLCDNCAGGYEQELLSNGYKKMKRRVHLD